MIQALNIILQGVLVGGLYALFATGLSIIFGVMRLVNLAHGDIIVAAAFAALLCVQYLGLSPLASIILVVPLMAMLGYFLQRFLLNRVLGTDILPPLLVTFGLSIIIQNGLLVGFSADSHKLDMGALGTASLTILPGLSIGAYPALIFIIAVAVIACLQMGLFRTRLGSALRATSDDATTIQLMGIDNKHIFAIAMAAAVAVSGLAGVMMAGAVNFDPLSGPSRLLFAFEAVIIGGLGSLWGTLAGGIILGVAQALGGAWDPGYQVLAGHVVFILVLMLMPRGLFPKMVD